MGRPRLGKEPRITVPVTLDPTVAAELTTRAQQLGTSRSSLANDYIVEGLVSSQETPPERRQETVTQHETPVPQQETTIGQRIQNGAITYTQATCGHPRNNRTNLGWGTRCNVCNAILKP